MSNGIQIAMTCPHCDEDYEVEVTQTGRSRRATLETPAEEPDVDVIGPEYCACGEPLQTVREAKYAIQKAYDLAADAALDRYLESRA